MDFKPIMLRNEELMGEYATRDKDAIRLKPYTEDPIRPNFYRDIDRIIYTPHIYIISTLYN